jgi:hypothetical protein
VFLFAVNAQFQLTGAGHRGFDGLNQCYLEAGSLLGAKRNYIDRGFLNYTAAFDKFAKES